MAQIPGVKEMTTNIVGKTQGSWHCDAKLGSGSFGIIHIWSNIKDDLVEKITTKQFKLHNDDPEKLKKVSYIPYLRNKEMAKYSCYLYISFQFEL